ncbi:unnamed protein product, partial [Prorocentrum cordatum]
MRLCAVALALAGALPTRALRAQNGTLGGGPEQGQREASEASWFKKIYFLHLAKTAGGSALLDLPRHLAVTTQLNSYECCWPRFSGLDAWEPPAVIPSEALSAPSRRRSPGGFGEIDSGQMRRIDE